MSSTLPKSDHVRPTSIGRWMTRKTFLLTLSVAVLLFLGVVVAWTIYTQENQELTQSLKQFEQGVVLDESPSYRETIAR